MKAADTLPRRDFFAIVFCLTGIAVLSWVYLLQMAQCMSMSQCATMAALQMHAWDRGYFLMMFTMWSVMMVGMMVPSAAPMILIYAAIAKKAEAQGTRITSTLVFTLGYLLMWVVFSLFVTLAQWQLDRAALLSPTMVANSPKFGAALLAAAGVYQWLPVKEACLEHCRSPFHFISSHWRSGKLGALYMGAYHGVYCIGCCWVLMLLLFVCGVMNILWIALITLFVVAEKLLPLGDRGGKAVGVIMVIIALLLFIR